MGRSKGKPQVSGFSGRTIGKMLTSKGAGVAQTPKKTPGLGKGKNERS